MSAIRCGLFVTMKAFASSVPRPARAEVRCVEGYDPVTIGEDYGDVTSHESTLAAHAVSSRPSVRIARAKRLDIIRTFKIFLAGPPHTCANRHIEVDFYAPHDLHAAGGFEAFSALWQPRAEHVT